MVIRGSGSLTQEFINIDDIVAAFIYVMNLDGEIFSSHIEFMLSHINVGIGINCKIKELV